MYFGIQQPGIDIASIGNIPLRHCAEAACLKCSYPDLHISSAGLFRSKVN